MANYPVELLDALDPNWRDLELDVVTFPAPPVAAKGMLYTPDGWHSSVFDRVDSDMFKNATVRAAAMTVHGPSFVLRRKLGSLMGLWGDRNKISPIYCATVSYEKSVTQGGVTFAKAAILEKVNQTSHSCHPGSHTAVPWAPQLTLLIELDNASRGGEYRYTDDITAEELFPGLSFLGNAEVDRLFRYATLGNAFGGFAGNKLRVPRNISDRLRRLVFERLVGNENLFRRFGRSQTQYMQAVDLRNQLQEADNGR